MDEYLPEGYVWWANTEITIRVLFQFYGATIHSATMHASTQHAFYNTAVIRDVIVF